MTTIPFFIKWTYKGQLSFFDRLSMPTEIKLVKRKTGKVHQQKYHVSTNTPPTVEASKKEEPQKKATPPTSKRLETLKQSLEKKEKRLDQKFDDHFADVKGANGQPLNDKRGGQATIDRWDRQSDSIRNQKESVEKTKRAIEREEGKIAEVEYTNKTLPTEILKLVESGELTQWRRHPNTFFVPGVDKGRLVWDEKQRVIAHKYANQIRDKDQWRKFSKMFNELRAKLNDNQALSPEEDYKKNGTRARAFKDWFGDWENDPENASKVVDFDGAPQKMNPIKVYHGTDIDFSSFDASKIGKNTGNYGHFGFGFYFTPEKREAKGYGKFVKAFYLNMRNPFTGTSEQYMQLREAGVEEVGDVVNKSINFESLHSEVHKIDEKAAHLMRLVYDKGYEDGWAAFLETQDINDEKLDLNMVSDWIDHAVYEQREVSDYILEEMKDAGINVDSLKMNKGFLYEPILYHATNYGEDKEHTKHVTQKIKSLGYDGIIIGSEHVVFEPSQIKAVDNIGTFDQSTDNIYKAAAWRGLTS